MSYIICSNIESDDLVKNGAAASPSSFTNFFKSPLIIEPNSEVAVESVKLTRGDEWEIKDNNLFFIYFGEEQSASRKSGDCAKNGVRITLARGSYNLEQMRKALEDGINKAPLGPELYGTCEVSINKNSTSLEFDGFEFKFSPRKVPTDSKEDIAATDFVYGNGATIKNSIDGYQEPAVPTVPFTYNDGTRTLTCNVTTPIGGRYLGEGTSSPNNKFMRSRCCARLRFNPLSAVNGGFNVNFNNASANPFIIGLSRPADPYYRNGIPSIIGGVDGNGGNINNAAISVRNELNFCDYWVQWDTVIGLRVLNWNYAPSNKSWTVQELKYWNGARASFTERIDTTKMNASSLDEIRFKLVGNELRLSIYSTTAKAEYQLVNSSTLGSTDRRYNFPLIGNSQEALFPVIALTQQNQSVVIETYGCHSISNWKHISTRTKFLTASSNIAKRNFPEADNTLVAGSDWYSNAELMRNVVDELRYNQLRPALRWVGSELSANFPAYTGVSGSNVIDYTLNLVVDEEKRTTAIDWEQVLYVIPLPPNVANMNRTLGFGQYSIIDVDTFGDNTDGVLTINSIDSGDYSVESAFIRINDLPIQSFNGATNSRSNILYHIPKFSNDGKQFGELYFNAPEKTYLKLNNTDKIMLSQITCDIVSRNERIIDDLRGATIIVLHIRKIKN